MSNVTVVPGAPITAGRLRLAAQILGLDPDKVKGFEANTRSLEASYGSLTYSQHKIVESDPWATQDERAIVIDVHDWKPEQVALLRSVISAVVDHARPRDAVPF